MDIHDPVRLALLVVGRRHHQGQVEAQDAQHEREPGGPGQDCIGDALVAERVGKTVHAAKIDRITP